LCASCAANDEKASFSYSPAATLMEFLSASTRTRAPQRPPRCPRCQTSFAEFRAEGRFGCSTCYKHFAAQIKNLLPRIHGGAYKHRGRAPKGRQRGCAD
jgi:protein arginine kinase activator